MPVKLTFIEKIANAFRPLDIEIVESDEGYSFIYKNMNIRLIDDEMNNTIFFVKQMGMYICGPAAVNITQRVVRLPKEIFYRDTSFLKNNPNIKAYWSKNYSCLYTKHFSCEKDVPIEDIYNTLTDFVNICEYVHEVIYGDYMF